MITSSLRPSLVWIVLAVLGIVPALLPALVDPGLWQLWIAYTGLLLVLLVADALLSPGVRNLSAELELAETMSVGVGQEAVVRCSASFGHTRRTQFRLDGSPDLEMPETFEGQLLMEPTRTPVRLCSRRRGTAEVTALWLRYTGPLGLAQRTVCLPRQTSLRVVPDIQAVRTMALSFANPRETTVGLKIERFTGAGSEFHAMRNYVDGLDIHSIDWKASARHTRLMCREHRAERNHHVVIAIDRGRLMSEELQGLTRLDHAIHGALLLAYMSLRAGDRVSLYWFDSNPGQLSPPCSGIASFQALLRISADLAYTSEETNFTLALTQLMTDLRRRALVVVLTDFVDTITAELMVDNIMRLCRRHMVVFGALRNPLFDRLIDTEPSSLADIERAVVCETLLRDRRLVLRRLQRAGVLCFDTVPSGIGPGLINRYLEIKRREMI